MSNLHALARDAGLQIDWRDAAGRAQRVSDGSLRAVLDALGLPAETAMQAKESRERLRRERDALSSRFVTADSGRPIELPPDLAGPGRLSLERGGTRAVRLGETPLAIEEPGYHRLAAGEVEITIAVSPPAAFTVADAAPGKRIWGTSVQIPSLRDRRGEDFGDFGTLASFVRAAGGHGAAAVAMSPVHALFPSDASRFSPYGPSSRLFLNALLADPSLLGDAGGGGTAAPLVDWQAAVPHRLARLRRLYEARSDRTRAELDGFRRAGGEPLERHARYDALYAHFLDLAEARDWQSWPEPYRDPSGEAVGTFAKAHADEVGFYVFLQWLADGSLAAAADQGRRAGLAVGLIADLAVGISPGGSEAWSGREHLLTGLSIGAPPDPLGPNGQDWGITSFSPRGLVRSGFRPFIATIRTALRHAGGIRIDHAMSLQRLWLVPHGASSREGAYLSYPRTDLMRLLALESWRAKAIVIGEDLGTVPSGFREAMVERGFHGMHVLWFERAGDGGFRPPGEWDADAVAMTSTHDLATIAGWWCGRDIDWAQKLGRSARSEAEDREERARERRRLWEACRKAGTAEGPEPAADEPETAVTAAVRYAASSPCGLAIVPVEDLLGEIEQPNLPGTIDEHPNWRRRLGGNAEDMLDGVADRLAALDRARRE